MKTRIKNYIKECPFTGPIDENLEEYVKKFMDRTWPTQKQKIHAFHSNRSDIASAFIKASDEEDDTQFAYQLVSALLYTATAEDKIDCLGLATDHYIYEIACGAEKTSNAPQTI